MNESIPAKEAGGPVESSSAGPDGVQDQAAETPPRHADMVGLQQRVVAEVERRRKAGAFPPAFEKMLRATFEKLIPQGGGTSRDDFQSLFRSTDRSAFMDIDVPLASRKPGVSLAKKAIRKLMAWYLNYLLQQITNFTANLMQLLAALDRRVRIVEDQLAGMNRVATIDDLKLFTSSATVDFALDVAKRSGGRTLVGNCGSSDILSRLALTGADCYGSDTNVKELEAAQKAGMEIRWSPLKEEVDNVRPKSLKTVVLQGSFELSPVSDILEVLKGTSDALMSGGTIVAICHEPGTVPHDADSRVAIDLSSGRFLHRETWLNLFTRIGDLTAEATSTNLETGEFVIVAHKLQSKVPSGDTGA